MKKILFLIIALAMCLGGCATSNNINNEEFNKPFVGPIQKIEKDQILVEYATEFNHHQKNRSYNIKLAASLIDGIILNEGEIFSFNKTVGKRTTKRGFKKAGIFIKGKKVIGIGGGICQVSSTLHAAAYNLGLKILKRSEHSRPVGYISRDLEATVSWGTLDLVFQNNTEQTLKVKATIKNENEIIVRFLKL